MMCHYRVSSINMPEFIESLMRGPFEGMNRSTVLSAITSESVSSVRVVTNDYKQIKVTYELMFDKELKKERQAQIQETEMESPKEVNITTRSTIF